MARIFGWVSSGFLLALLTAAVAGAGQVDGVVRFKGKPREPKELSLQSDAACMLEHPGQLRDEKFVVGEGRDGVYPLANVFVRVVSGLKQVPPPPPKTPVIIDQKGCVFIPHVAGLQVGQELRFRNSDNAMHNVHLMTRTSSAFNKGMPAGSPDLSYEFSAPEIMARARCDSHPWMGVYIGVVEHPFFAVTGLDGRFVLAGLEDGEYGVEAWQELLGTRTGRVTVTNGAGRIEFEYVKGE